METLVIVAGFLVVGMMIAPIFLMRGQFGKPKGRPAAGHGGDMDHPGDSTGGDGGGD